MPNVFDEPCKGCPFYGAQHLPVKDKKQPLSLEDNKSKILLIFQSPGIEEWCERKPIIGSHPSSAGARLRASFDRLDRSRQDYNITNAVQCFPGKMLNTGSPHPRDNPIPSLALEKCSSWLRREIEDGDYRRIVVFGAKARRAVQKLGYTTDARFRFVRHPTGGLSNESLDSALSE